MNKTPRAVIDRWLAFHAVEPLPEPWRQSATIAHEVYNVAKLTAARGGGELPAATVDDWIPAKAKRSAKAEAPAMTMDDSRRWAMKQAGIG